MWAFHHFLSGPLSIRSFVYVLLPWMEKERFVPYPDDLKVDELKTLVHHIGTCLKGDAFGGVASVLAWLQEILECHASIVCQLEVGNGLRIRQVVNSTYDPDWIDIYAKNEFYEIDPVLGYACSARGLFTWNQAYESAKNRIIAKSFFQAASNHNLSNGFAYSFVSGSSANATRITLCSFATTSPAMVEKAEYFLGGIAPVLHTVISSCPKDNPLSQREIEVLRWAKEGKTVWEVSRIMGLSEATIKFHLLNIYRKLEVSNRAHAIAKSLELGLPI